MKLDGSRQGKAKPKIQEIEIPSSARIASRCAHAEHCGGCSWQHAVYEAQLLFKQQQIDTLFKPFITEGASLKKIIPCVDVWNYRNKMEFSFSQDLAGERYLGLMLRRGRGRVLNLQECCICGVWMTEALKLTHTWWRNTCLNAYHPHRDTGSLRTLTLREGKRTQDKMAILTVSGRPEFAISRKDLEKWTAALVLQFPGISCFLRVQQACKGMPTQFYEIHLAGLEYIREIIGIDLGDRKISLTLQISPSSFFQPNTLQSERIYSEALKLLELSHEEHILDLYAGTATIGMALATKAKKVTSIELNPYALIDAEANLLGNNIVNLELIQGDAGEVLTKISQNPEFIAPNVVVVDPPRGGLGVKALDPILRLAPHKLLYISCNPTTQATDLEILAKNGYRLLLLQPIDQFPHTPHVENIALLERRFRAQETRTIF